MACRTARRRERQIVLDFLGDALGWVTGLIEAFGYPGLAVVLALESVFPPIPSEAVLPLAGFLVGQGRMGFVGAVIAATVGAVVGALILYWLGAALGERRVRALVERHGRWLFLSTEDLDRAQDWFDRHGGAAVFIGRLAPLVRSLVSVPAGVARMPLPAFVAYTALGSALWNTVLIGAGWALGESWGVVQQYQKLFGYAVLGALGLAVAWFVSRRLGSGSRDAAATSGRD
jgi:membrane protein DedA with SNARE-associated domain